MDADDECFHGNTGLHDREMELMVKVLHCLTLLILLLTVPGLWRDTAFANTTLIRPQIRLKACMSNEETLSGAVELYLLEHPDQVGHVPLFEALLQAGTLKSIPGCPSQGTYSFTRPDPSDTTIIVTCDRHGTMDDSHVYAPEVMRARIEYLAIDIALPLSLLFLLVWAVWRFCRFLYRKLKGETGT